jgi:O-antigen/teichoic acid export membrane protein
MEWVWKLVLRLKERLDGQLNVLIKNSSWVFFANGVRTLLTFVKSIIIARGLGADLYGNYVLVVAFVGTIQEFFNLNIGAAVIKFGADYQGAERLDKLVALVKASLLFGLATLVLSVLAVVGATQVAYDTFLSEPGLELYVILFAITSGMTFFNSISQGLLRLFYRFKTNSLIQMASGFLGLVMMAGALYLYPGELGPFLIAMIIFWLLDGVLINAGALWELRGDLKGHFAAPMSLVRDDLKEIGGFVVSNSGSRTLKTLMDRGDVLILGALASEHEVSFYDIAKKLAYTILRFTDPLVSSIYPQIASLAAKQRFKAVRLLLRRVTAGLLIPSLVAIGLCFFLGEWVIVTMYGEEYSDAAQPFLWHLGSATLAAAFFWLLPLMQSLGVIHSRFFISLGAVTIGASLAWPLAQSHGAIGVAVASLAAKLFMTVASLYVSNRKLGTLELRVLKTETRV